MLTKAIYRYEKRDIGYYILVDDEGKGLRHIRIPLRVPTHMVGERRFGELGTTEERYSKPLAMKTAEVKGWIHHHYAGLQGVRA